MADEKASRSSSRRRRRPRRSSKQNTNEASGSWQGTIAKERDTDSSWNKQDLPQVFIYTYTIYKTGD